jgi:hypothetical protein
MGCLWDAVQLLSSEWWIVDSEKCCWAGDPPNGLRVSPSGAPFQDGGWDI